MRSLAELGMTKNSSVRKEKQHFRALLAGIAEHLKIQAKQEALRTCLESNAGAKSLNFPEKRHLPRRHAEA